MPTYCTLADAYGPTWGAQRNNNNNTNNNVDKVEEKRIMQYKQADKAPQGEEIKHGCPNCQHCLNQNNQFQQKVVDQSIRPLPRWIPQESNIQEWDPFTRHFFPKSEGFGNMSYNRTEHFGNITTTDANHLIQLVLYLLITLFIIQLLELFSSLT